MIKEDIPLYKLDLTGVDKYNRVDYEYGFRKTVKNNNIVIPRGAPFYQKSFKLYSKDGQELVEGTHWEFYGIMGKLTQFTGKPVGLFVRLLDDSITEWYWDYQVVGNFNKITNEILNMLHSIYEDDRYVWWENIENKPLWFVPEIHQHDLAYQIYGFTDLARELNRIANIEATMKRADAVIIKQLQDNIDYYIAGFKTVLTDLITSHDSNKKDAHGVRKQHMGLDKVDNFATATLEETLEGLRDDLHITPYNAAIAATTAAGRNERLFPSGSLPLLRYGSDTFIPPTIMGSFEGLGGVTSRCGALIENDGTLLALRHRNNGKVRGLYFSRCSNWQSKDAEYEFTAYTYQHPTATAVGATLDTIINGSNQYVMVVGDAVKGLYWWCETHGTFNPDRHVLIPISGPWTTEDMNPANYNPNNIYNNQGLANVCADANYKDDWCILQGHTLSSMQSDREDKILDWDTMGNNSWGGGAVINGGYSIHVVVGNTIQRVDVDYTHPKLGKFNDKYWSPQWPEVIIEGGIRKIKSYYGDYTVPVRTIQLYNSPRVFWKKFKDSNDFAIRIDFNGREFTFGGDGGASRVLSNKARISFSTANNVITAKVTPAEGHDTLWAFDAGNRNTDEYRTYINYCGSQLVISAQDQTGVVQLSDGFAFSLSGTGNVAFPPAYSAFEANFLKSAENILAPDNTTANTSFFYKWKRFNEVNPIGMGSMFAVQRCMVTDNNNPLSSGIMVRQLKTSADKPDGYSEWFYRPVSYMNANWDHIAPPSVSSFNGQTLKHYPFVSNGAVVKGLGFQVPVVSQLPIPGTVGGVNKTLHTKMLGASSTSRLMGLMDWDEAVSGPFGDFKLVVECAVTMDGANPTYKPVSVVDIKTALTNNIIPIFTAVGFTAQEVLDTWILGRVLSPTGAEHVVVKAYRIIPDTLMIESCCVVVTLAVTGTPTQHADGYLVYPTATFTKLSEPNSIISEGPAQGTNHGYPRYDKNVGNTPGYVLGIPFKSRNGATVDRTTYTVAIMPDARYSGSGGSSVTPSLIEVSADGRTILNHSRTQTPEWGAEALSTFIPYYGYGNAGQGMTIFEGAAIASQVIDQTQGIYQAAYRGLYETTRVIGMSNILIPQYTIYFQDMKDILLAGKMYDIPATYIDLLVEDPNPANKTYYIYLAYSGAQVTYLATTEVRPESATQSLIAKVKCGATQIDSIIPYNRFSMDGASISADRQGSSILASSGSLYEIGNTSSILLDGDFVP